MKTLSFEKYQELLKRKEEVGIKKLAEELGWSRTKLSYWLYFKSFLTEDDKKIIKDVKGLLAKGYFLVKDIADALMVGRAQIVCLLYRNPDLRRLLKNNLEKFLELKKQSLKNLKRANATHTCLVCKKKIYPYQYYFRELFKRENFCLKCGMKKFKVLIPKKILSLLKKINSKYEK